MMSRYRESPSVEAHETKTRLFDLLYTTTSLSPAQGAALKLTTFIALVTVLRFVTDPTSSPWHLVVLPVPAVTLFLRSRSRRWAAR